MSTRTTEGYNCQLVQKSKREGRGEKKQNDNCKILALHANAKKNLLGHSQNIKRQKLFTQTENKGEEL